MMKKTKLIIVGGFLGAGKTTLLYETSKQLTEAGNRIGLVTNDQAPELVDTALLLHSKLNVEEVAGSCFCCNFEGLSESIKKVQKETDADFIIAEPVGSCTDLVATIIEPMNRYLGAELSVAPLTVLADVIRLKNYLFEKRLLIHPSAHYIYEKQLEESDVILISKSDLVNQSELAVIKEKLAAKYPLQKIITLSSKTGDGLSEWLDTILNKESKQLGLSEIDYDIYAEGEAVLGWLNGSLNLAGAREDWDAFLKRFLDRLGNTMDNRGAGIGHIKVLIENGESFAVGNITGTSETLTIRGKAGTGDTAKLTINARVNLSPDELEKLVEKTLEKTTNKLTSQEVTSWNCFSPAYPRPTYRFINP